MSSPKPVNKKLLRVAAVLVAVGVLLIVVGALINGEWPTDMAVLGPSIAIVAVLILWFSLKDQHGGTDD
jgi:drug/metabolite transporter (DMT)-like permease